MRFENLHRYGPIDPDLQFAAKIAILLAIVGFLIVWLRGRRRGD
jgi:hypothetical protein